MSTQVAFTPSSSPSLFIPHEMLGEILSHCDVCTLAVVSCVSSACLELASPFLYTDIVLRDLQSIVKLFRLSPSFGAALPKSGRVTSQTSLSLVHSITVRLEETPIDFDPLRKLALAPPLALAVFVLSMPGPNSSISSRHYHLSPVAQLVNPRRFIVHERQSKLDSIHYNRSIVDLPDYYHAVNFHHWASLEVVVLTGASVNFWDLLHSRLPAFALASGPPLPPIRMVVDLIGAPARQFAETEHAEYFVGMNKAALRLSYKKVVLKAWVGSEGSKKVLEEKMKAPEQASSGPPAGKHADVQVASDRVLRFREALALGVRKRMDWAVLDEV